MVGAIVSIWKAAQARAAARWIREVENMPRIGVIGHPATWSWNASERRWDFWANFVIQDIGKGEVSELSVSLLCFRLGDEEVSVPGGALLRFPLRSTPDKKHICAPQFSLGLDVLQPVLERYAREHSEARVDESGIYKFPFSIHFCFEAHSRANITNPNPETNSSSGELRHQLPARPPEGI